MRFGIAAAWAFAAVFAAGTDPDMLMGKAFAVEVAEGSSFTPTLPQPSDPSQAEQQTPAQSKNPSKDCFILGSKTFSVPFTVNSTGVKPSEVHVFVKRDSSAEWDLLARKSPDAAGQAFQFTASSDGEYWFATRTIDSRGRPHPSGTMRPQLKVFVDTTKPDVGLVVDAEADGTVTAKIVIQDATPLKNIQLRYATDSVAEWRQVDLKELPTDGSVPIKPDAAWNQISVQCIVTDTPGNQSVMQRLTKRPRLATKPSHRIASTSPEAMTPAAQPGTFDRGGLKIQPAPFRSDYVNRLRTEPVSNPVIQLDRHRHAPPPSPGVEPAYGYSGDATALGFRGMQNGVPVSRRDPPTTSPPRVTNASPELSAPPTLGGFPLPEFSATETPQNGLPQTNAAPGMSAPGMTAPGIAGSGIALTPASEAERAQAARQFASQFAQPQTKPAPSQSVEQIAVPPGVPEETDASPLDLRGPQQADEPEATDTTPPRRRANSPAEAMRPMSEDALNEAATIPSPTAGQSPLPATGRDAQPATNTENTPRPASEAAQAADSSAEPYRALRQEPTPEQLRLSMQRAPRRFSDSLRFSLEYELEAVGSLGVEAVELYGTVDSGKTWQLWGRDPDRTSPFDIETKEEGEFGFRIVVVGQNGLASPRPLTGESPDIVVVVDTTAPTARITGAQYGEGDRVGSLVIRYQCGDVHLQQRPVAMSFSNNVTGPWTTIAAGLRNDGDYVWPADPKLPRKFYLRIDVTDEAGNVGTYILEEPIDAQGMAPRARIRGFQTLSGQAQPQSDDQTAKRSWSIFQ